MRSGGVGGVETIARRILNYMALYIRVPVEAHPKNLNSNKSLLNFTMLSPKSEIPANRSTKAISINIPCFLFIVAILMGRDGYILLANIK